MPNFVYIPEEDTVATGYHNWKTLEGSGTVLADTTTGTAVDLAHGGGWGTGSHSYPCITVAGTKASVTDASLNSVTGFTFAAWMLTSQTEGPIVVPEGLFGQSAYLPLHMLSPGFSFHIVKNALNPGIWHFQIDAANGHDTSSFDNSWLFSRNTWYHVAVVCHVGTNGVTDPDAAYFYVNGYLHNSYVQSNAVIGGYLAAADGKEFMVGQCLWGNNQTASLTGSMEDIWWHKNHEATAEEILNIYKVRA